MKKLEFYPIGNRVLVEKPKLKEVKTSSGIYMPESTEKSKEHLTVSKIVALGDDLKSDNLKIGTKVKFTNPHELTHEGKEYYLIHESNIQLVFDWPYRNIAK